MRFETLAIHFGRVPVSAEALEHGRLPDPVNDALRLIIAEQSGLAERLRRLEEPLRIQKDDETPEKRGNDRGMAHG